MARSATAVAIALGATALLFSGGALARQPAPTDPEVRRMMIRESLASYPGNCPCPYNTDRAGRSCGRRSAYSRPGGYAPLCYPSDISKAEIERYRAEHGLSRR